MRYNLKIVFIVFFVTSTSYVDSATTIAPCPLQAQENTADFELDCRDLNPNHQVSWQRSKDGIQTPLGSCDPLPGECLSTVPQLVTVTRPETNVSRLRIASVDRELYGGAVFTCTAFDDTSSAGSSSCPMDVIYKAEVGTCRVEPMLNGSDWMIRVSCFIDKVYSSRNLYCCELLQTQNKTKLLASSTYSPDLSNGSSGVAYGDGECALTTEVPTDPANYTVRIYPGPTLKFAGGFIPILPTTQPALTCSPNQGSYVMENKFIECSCVASDMGHPSCRLHFYREEALLVSGAPGDSRVTLPGQKLGRADNGTVFTCQLVCDWAGAGEGMQLDLHANISVGVAYGPEQVELTDPGIFNIHPSGLETMTLTCTVTSFGPSVTLTWKGACVGHVGNTCTFAPSIEDERTAVTCVAYNRFTNITKVATRPLVLNYPPQEAPIITGLNGSSLHPGQSLMVTCDVIGGLPPVSAVTLTCKGQGQEVAGQRSELNISLEASDHGDKCSCSARWKISDYYTLYTDVFFVVPQPPEILPLTVNGTGGMVTVEQSTKDSLVLACVSRGVPSPSLVLLKDERTEVAKKAGGQISREKLTSLSVVLPALCQSSAQYTCLSQGAGLEERSTIILNVRCLPQTNQREPTSFLLDNSTSSLSFQLESNPPPTLFSFRYLGPVGTDNPREQPLHPRVFNVSCSRTDLTSLQDCIIRVVTLSEVTQGLYVLVVQNDLGETRFRFIVTFDHQEGSKAESKAAEDTEDESLLVAVIVLSVAFAIAVGAFIAFLVYYIWRRRQKLDNTYSLPYSGIQGTSATEEEMGEIQLPSQGQTPKSGQEEEEKMQRDDPFALSQPPPLRNESSENPLPRPHSVRGRNYLTPTIGSFADSDEYIGPDQASVDGPPEMVKPRYLKMSGDENKQNTQGQASTQL